MESDTLNWFDDLPVLGQLPAREAAPRLRAMDVLDDRQAQELERRGDARLAEIVLLARARPEA